MIPTKPLFIAQVFIALTVPCGLYAQEKISLQEAIDAALANDSGYRISMEKETESGKKISEAWGKLWPDLSSDISETRWGADKGTYSGSDGVYNVSFIKGSLSVNPGNFYNTLKIARDTHSSSVYEERRMRSEITASVIRLYYTTMLSDEIVKLKNDSVRALEENFRIVSAGTKSGNLSSLDQLRAKVSLANEKARLIAAENDYQNAKASLNIFLGRSITSTLDLDGSAMFADNDEIAKITGMSAAEQDSRLTFLIGEAVKNRPEVVQIRLKKDIADADRNLQQSVYLWPTFFASGNYGTSKTINPEKIPDLGDPEATKIMTMVSTAFEPTGWVTGWSVTAGASYKWGALSPADSSHARAGQSESRGRQADLEADDLVKKIQIDIQRGMLKMISAAHALEAQKDNVQSATEYFRIATIQFRNGMIDNSKLLDADVELKSARTLYVQALFDFQTAKADINRAVGYNIYNFQ
jgi:outer membrane protein TolC